MRRQIVRAMLAFAVVAVFGAFGRGAFPVRAEAPFMPPPTPPGAEVATFAGGCFWCVESDFDKLPGVISTVSGYMGGSTPSPTYHQVAMGFTGHREVVQVTFDPKVVGYDKLVAYFWRKIDPYDTGGQFCDRGDPYKTAIFTHSDEQKRIAEASKAELKRSGPKREPIATEIREAGPFTPAEAYHQDYYKANPVRYEWYRLGCRRDARVEAIWGKSPTQ